MDPVTGAKIELWTPPETFKALASHFPPELVPTVTRELFGARDAGALPDGAAYSL